MLPDNAHDVALSSWPELSYLASGSIYEPLYVLYLECTDCHFSMAWHGSPNGVDPIKPSCIAAPAFTITDIRWGGGGGCSRIMEIRFHGRLRPN